MPGTARRESVKAISFYDLPENEIHQMATGHYGARKNIQSAFSSWAASLHLALLREILER
jgi:hypothetical protein